MSVLPNERIYKESTAAQLLRPRIDYLISNGGLDYKELNRRIVADNRVENIKCDHNPVYGGINRSVCAVERQESFTISDKTNSFDNKCYTLFPRKVFIKTSDTSIVDEAAGFWGDNIKININSLLENLTTKATSLEGFFVDGTFELDKQKIIIDESIKNPWNIDFSDEDNILLVISPFKNNAIPVIFRPNSDKLNASFFNVSLLILDERQKAVTPEISEGTYITVSALTSENSSSYKDKKGVITSVITGTIEGSVLNAETKEELTNVSCEVSIGNTFPEIPTNYDRSGIDDVAKLAKTLFANVVIKQASIRDLKIVLPIVYLSDERDELVPITSLEVEQTEPVVITYDNSGYTYRGESCVLVSDVVSSVLTVTAKDSDGSSVEININQAVVEKSLNKDQKSTKATVTLTNKDDIIAPLIYNLLVEDQRPYKAKEYFSITSSFSVTIKSSDWNAGLKGQAWIGDSIEITGDWTKVKNQFGKEITKEDVLLQSFCPIETNIGVLDVCDKYPIEILSSEDVAGSSVAKAKLYLLLKNFSVIDIPIEISVTDQR